MYVKLTAYITDYYSTHLYCPISYNIHFSGVHVITDYNRCNSATSILKENPLQGFVLALLSINGVVENPSLYILCYGY
jgi:hypothetical protein